jgi:hypothetical protein
MTQVTALFRAHDASFDVEENALVVRGDITYGMLDAGMLIQLPTKSGTTLDLTVEWVEPASDSVLLAVRLPVAGAKLAAMLDALDVVGSELRVHQPAAEAADGTPNRVGKANGSTGVAGCVNGALGGLGLLILGAALLLPSMFGQKSSAHNALWMGGAIVAFIGAATLLTKDMRWAIVVLLFACAFFFVSCVANFRLHAM